MLLLAFAGAASTAVAANPAVPATAGVPQRDAGAGTEVASLRTEFSRTRQLTSGVLETTLSNTPLNYRTGNGSWRRIDNRLTRAADGTLSTRANSVDVTIPNVASGPVEFRDGDHSLSFSLLGAPPAPADVDGRTVGYADVKRSADLSYEVDGRSLKETLTLSSPDAPSVYRFDVDADGLSPRLRASGDVAFVDAGGRQRLGFQAPWMRDADGTLSRAASYALERVDGRDVVVLRLDADWLSSAERRFPVVVDPTVYSGWEEICEIRSGSRSNSSQCAGTLSQTSVGRDASGIVYRNLFELQDLRAVLPDYAQILDSWFAVYLNGQTPVGSSEIDLHHLTRGFAPGVTWNRSDGRALWTRAGGDYAAQVLQRLDTRYADPSDGWMAFDITQLARDLVTGATTSPNLLLKAADETRSHLDSFDDAEVKVRWHPRAGIAPQYTYERFDLSDGSTLRYNVANGNLTLAADDLGWRPNDGRTPTARYFNSLNALDGDFRGVFGLGTQGSFGSVRLEHHWLNDSYLFAGPSGTTGVFHRRLDGGFSSPAGVDATLTAQTDGTFTLQWNDSGELWTFDRDLELAQTRATDGYTVEIGWSSGRMASLTDSAGRRVTAGYDSGGRLRTLTDQDGRVHRYDYDSLNGLVSYTSPSGAETRYTWDTLDRVTRISLPDRTALKIAYSGSTHYPATITPVDANGVDQIATNYEGGDDWSWAQQPGNPRTAWFFDPNTLVVDLIQHGSDAAIATSGQLPGLDGGYTRGDAALTVDVSAAQVPDGIMLTELEVDDVEVDSVGAAPCDQSTCPTRARERLAYDPTFDPEGSYAYRVNTVDGDDQHTDGPLWRLAIDRTGPSVGGMFSGAHVGDGETIGSVWWDGAADPALPDGTPGSGLGDHLYRFRRAGGAWSSWSRTTTTAFALPGAADGEQVDLEVQPLDRLGNVGGTYSAHLTVVTINRDDLPPELVLAGQLADRDGDYAGAGVLRLDVHAEDGDGTGVRSIVAQHGGVVSDRFDSDCASGCPGSVDVQLEVDTRALPEGPNDIEVSAVDGAGNSSEAGQVISILVDKSGPSAPTRIVLRDFDATAGEVTLDWMEGDDPDLGTDLPGAGQEDSEFRWRLAGGAWSDWQRVAGSDAVLRGVRENDSIEVELRSIDGVGNRSATATAGLSVRRDEDGTGRMADICTPRIDYARARSLRPDYRAFREVKTMLGAQLNVFCVTSSTERVVLTGQLAYHVRDNDYRIVGGPPTPQSFKPRQFRDVKVRGIQAICLPNMAGHRDYIVIGEMKFYRDDAVDRTISYNTDVDDAQELLCPVENERRRREVAGWRALTRLSGIDPTDEQRRVPSAQLRRALPSEPWKPRNTRRAWAAHHIVPATDPRTQDMQALLFRCRVHPNSPANGVWLRGPGLRKTHSRTGLPNDDYETLERERPELAVRTYHGDTTNRQAYVDELRDRFDHALETHTENCPDGTAEVLNVLEAAEGALKRGTFPVGSPRN